MRKGEGDRELKESEEGFSRTLNYLTWDLARSKLKSRVAKKFRQEYMAETTS
jgi:hypothetical protein